MSSDNLSIQDCDSLDDSSEELVDKETQTSYAYITDSFDLVKGPSRPLPKGIDKSQVQSTVDNILGCRVLKDLSDSKSEELGTESIIKDIIHSNSSESIDEVSESPTSLQYCQEVAKPYLKTHLKDCEDNVESLEQLIQDALGDFPCYEIYEGQDDIQEKLNENMTTTMDAIPNEINEQEERTAKINSNTTKDPEKTEDDSTILTPPDNINNVKEDFENEIIIKKDEEIHKSLSMESIRECIKESLIATKRSASSCLDKLEIMIGLKKPEGSDDKPTYYTMKNLQTDVGPSHNVQTETGNSLKNLLNDSCEKIATFKDACKDFAENLMSNPNERMCAIKDTCKDFAENLLNIPDERIRTVKETCKEYAGKFYSTSKDCISLLATESAKLLNKSNTGFKSDDNSNENQHKQKEKPTLTISVESITSFLFKKAENTPVNDDPPKDNAIMGPSGISDIITPAVKLSFCKLRDIRDDIVCSNIDKSSAYDIPSPKEPIIKPPEPPLNPPETRMPTVSAIDHTPEPPAPSNVFAIIRSKIFSIFSSEGDKSTEPAIQENDDDDDDPFEKFMEQ